MRAPNCAFLSSLALSLSSRFSSAALRWQQQHLETLALGHGWIMVCGSATFSIITEDEVETASTFIFRDFLIEIEAETEAKQP